MKNKQLNNNRGFTLLELLIVVAIISILAVVVFVAIDPLTRMKESRNAQRQVECNSILDATLQYVIDNTEYPAGLNTDIHIISSTPLNSGCDDCGSTPQSQPDCLDMSVLVDQGYLGALPIDQKPQGAQAGETRYWINRSANGITTVGACDAEDDLLIQSSR